MPPRCSRSGALYPAVTAAEAATVVVAHEHDRPAEADPTAAAALPGRGPPMSTVHRPLDEVRATRDDIAERVRALITELDVAELTRARAAAAPGSASTTRPRATSPPR